MVRRQSKQQAPPILTQTSNSPLLARFIAASGLANLADGVAVVVWAWVATLLTREPVLIALMPIALRLPWMLFALPAGVVTDRTDRRRLIIAMDIVRAVAFAAAAVVIFASLPFDAPSEGQTSHPLVFAALMLCALVVGTAEVFRDNAAQTMLPAIVPHDRLERANGRLWSVELVGNALLGPALGAFLIAALVWLPFATNALCFALAALLMWHLRGSFRPRQPGKREWRVELREGWAFLQGAPLLKRLAVYTGIWNMLHQMIMIALVLHVQENLELGARGYGLILAAGAVGGIIGGLTSDRIVKWAGAAASAQWTLLISGIAYVAIIFAPNGWWLAAVLAFFEFTGLVWNTVSVSYRQKATPDNLLGRVNSIYRLLAWGMMPIGLLLSGLLVSFSEAIMPRDVALIVPFVVAAVGGILLTAAAWRALAEGFAGYEIGGKQ